MNKNEVTLFETMDNEVKLSVTVRDDTVWLNRNQMAELFGRDVKTIGKHINNALREELDDSTVAKFATVQYEGELRPLFSLNSLKEMECYLRTARSE